MTPVPEHPLPADHHRFHGGGTESEEEMPRDVCCSDRRRGFIVQDREVGGGTRGEGAERSPEHRSGESPAAGDHPGDPPGAPAGILLRAEETGTGLLKHVRGETVRPQSAPSGKKLHGGVPHSVVHVRPGIMDKPRASLFERAEFRRAEMDTMRKD